MFFDKQGRLTQEFAEVPALLDLPAIPGEFSESSHQGSVDLAEGCLVTKTLSYTHKLSQWVIAVTKGDPTDVEDLIEDLCIVPFTGFKIDHPSNLSFLDLNFHASLHYGFVAVTASATTLDDLITMVRSDNKRRQQEVDQMEPFGAFPRRTLDFSTAAFLNPEYELVVLHPSYFFPDGGPFVLHDRTTQTNKRYFVAKDERLRESSDPNSSRFPAFRHTFESRNDANHLNALFIILNAEVKFSRYFEMIKLNPPPTPLPDDVLALMKRTMELVELLYWTPVPTTGPLGKPMSENTKMMEDPKSTSSSTRNMKWFAEADLESRIANGRTIINGHDGEYDPTLFEDVFPINYSA